MEPVNKRTSFADTKKDPPNNDKPSTSKKVSLAEFPYIPVVRHWFYKRRQEKGSFLWKPFSKQDSNAIDRAQGTVPVSVEGGLYDVIREKKLMMSVYWKEDPLDIQLCSWFYQIIPKAQLTPFDEHTCNLLEQQYEISAKTNNKRRKVVLENGDLLVFQAFDSILYYNKMPEDDVGKMEALSTTSLKKAFLKAPRLVTRGVDKFSIDQVEILVDVDRVLFVIYGIGGSVVTQEGLFTNHNFFNFSKTIQNLLSTQYAKELQGHNIGRMEVIPIAWYNDAQVVGEEFKQVLEWLTLETLSPLRGFTTNTLFELLFRLKPQSLLDIIGLVGCALNEAYGKFCQRHDHFKGKVYLMGHSLGSIICFDLLCMQPLPDTLKRWEYEELMKDNTNSSSPILRFSPQKMFCIGSPLGMFLLMRGIKSLGLKFYLPTCPSFYNIFHPYDPIAYRLEPLINPDLRYTPPMKLPHKTGSVDEIKANIKQFYQDVRKTVSVHLKKEEHEHNSTSTDPNISELGKLNNCHRLDYVLEDSALGVINDYVFAFSSHTSYWQSEDTAMFIVAEIYRDELMSSKLNT